MIRFGAIVCFLGLAGRSIWADALPAPSVFAQVENAATSAIACSHTMALAAQCSSNGVDALANAANLGMVEVNSLSNGYWGEAIVNYDVEVIGPSGVFVPVLVSGSASVALTGTATGFARFFVQDPNYEETFAADCSGIPNCRGNGDFSLSIGLESQNVSYVELFATAGRGTGLAMLDPLFTIDPTFARASEFQLEISPGVVTTPEPRWTMLLVLGCTFWRFRLKPHIRQRR